VDAHARRRLIFNKSVAATTCYDSSLAWQCRQKRHTMSIDDPFNEHAWDCGIALRAHSTPDPDAEPPGPNPNPDDVPPPAHSPVKEPTLPEPPIKAGSAGERG
jgi:hypothetical protein